jgi:type I restriction-modification system DNA methylase subunit
MPLFQQSVLKKYISDIDKTELEKAWERFQQHFFNSTIQENIRNSKEEEYQEGFVRDLFVNVLGYTLNPKSDYNFVLEKKTSTDGTKSDGAILLNGDVIGVIELKDTGTTDLDKVSNQAFSYKHKHKNCIYVITSNFEKLRFYINDATDYEEFELFTLSQERFALLFLCLQLQNISANIPLKIKQQSLVQEENVTKKLYADYSLFKRKLFQNIAEKNTQHDKLVLFKKTQKLLDRFLFIFFAEDRLLLPPNSVREILNQWEQLKELDNYVPLYDRFKKYFGYLNVGHVGKQYEIFAYNGGLFLPDEILDTIIVDDGILYDGTKTLSGYDFETDVDVNILGHIFEHSLTEIEELQLELEGKAIEKNKTKRKKEGVFYTPRYITKYIVENTVGALCTQKKEELEINEETFTPKKRKDRRKILLQKIEAYREWLLQLTICDPACGSGAFLNAALEYLKAEHKTVDELTARIFGDAIVYTDLENSILEKNLFGVDINEDATEIAKLSLWLHTAKKGRKLSTLSNNIKFGNSLIDDATVAGDKAFKWREEFKNVFDNGGFDVVIGNPPWVISRNDVFENEKEYYFTRFKYVYEKPNLYLLFMEKSFELLKKQGYLGLIVPNSWLGMDSGKRIREFILNNTSIRSLIGLQGESFPNVNVETVIITYEKVKPKSNDVYFQNIENPIIITTTFHKIGQESWKSNRNYIIDILSDSTDTQLLQKIKNDSVNLSTVFDVRVGMQAYETGKGYPPQTAVDVKKHIFDYTYKFDENTFPYLSGTDVGRYCDNWSGQWLRWGKWLSQPKEFIQFNSERILIREITSPYPKVLNATFLNATFLNNKSIISILNKDNDYNLKFLLVILNSKVISFFHRRLAVKGNRKLFPKVVIGDLNSYPIKNITLENQQPFIIKADVMLQQNKELNLLSQNFTSLLQTKFPAININNKLEKWYSLTGNQFLNELSKQKIKLSLSDQQEWLQYFEQQKLNVNKIQQTIQKTDKQIDAMVYKLYGLNEEEISTVEGEGI